MADRREVGKLFQMTGPVSVTVKLLVPSVVLVLGTDSDPVPADRRCHLPAMVEIYLSINDKGHKQPLTCR